MSFKVNATPGPWEVCTFSDSHPNALPNEVAVFAPKHPGSKLLEDGTWDGVTICRGMTGPARHDNATLIACVPEMLEMLKMVWRKHVSDDPSIGWEELGDKLGDTLSNAMGVEAFNEWLESEEQ
jgi:hypothetical protein